MCNLAFCENAQKLPSNVSVARVNCIGRIDPVTVADAFMNGVDAVMLAGCRPPDCHYVEGNLQAERMVKMFRKLLASAGLEPERLKLIWYSPFESESFEHSLRGFIAELSKLAPLSSKENSKLILNLSAVRNAAADFQLRVLAGREKELTESVNVYGEKLSEEEFDELLDDVVEMEFVRQKIHLLTRTKPQSVRDLSDVLGMKPAAVLKQIVNMRRKNMITFDHLEGQAPLYKALEVK
jgi:coenzyme F420-reducing hydrogenase delta subunit